MSLLVHRGGHLVTRDDLALIAVPESTESYLPVPHNHLADTLATIGRDILQGFTFHKEQYAVSREGLQMFGVHVFKSSHTELGLSVGFRNSYDKSMSIGIAIGAEVFVCDNLALTGDITIMKKHTRNVWQGLEDAAISTLYRSIKNFEQICSDSEAMRGVEIGDDEAFRMIGLLFGHGILSPRQLPVVKEQWLNPAHDDFQPRNVWSFYNAATEALKSTPPIAIMEKHIQLHALITEN